MCSVRLTIFFTRFKSQGKFESGRHTRQNRLPTTRGSTATLEPWNLIHTLVIEGDREKAFHLHTSTLHTHVHTLILSFLSFEHGIESRQVQIKIW